MKTLRFIILLSALSVGMLFSCKRTGDKADNMDNVLVKVGEQVLTEADLMQALPPRLSPQDSLSFVNNYVHHWMENQLLYDAAVRNIPDLQRIDRLVEEYRRQLVSFEYQKQLIAEKLDKEITEEDLENYYKQNASKFVLNSSIIKGLFLKIPENAPQIEQVRQWYRSNTPQNIEKIEKYSLRNAIIYEYFFDRWVSFDEVMDNIPYPVPDETAFLKNNKTLEVKKDGYYYFLNIGEYLLKGGQEPFDFARLQIRDILINKRKMQFIENFQHELYRRALEKNQITFYQWKDTLDTE